MAKLSHRLEFALAVTGMKLAQALPRRVAGFLARGVGSLTYHLVGSRRRIAMDNLAMAFGDHYSEAERRRITKRVFQGIAQVFFEFARFPKWSAEQFRSFVVPAGEESLWKAHEEGRGLMVASAHFGNWETVGNWLAAIGLPTDLIVATQHNPLFDDMITKFRANSGVGIIRRENEVRQIYRAFKANRVIATACDQHAASAYVVTPMFGRDAATVKGPALFAVRCNCPIIPLLGRRDSFERFTLLAGEPIYPPNSGDEEADISEMMNRYIQYLESQIREYPDQWMWTHRRWKLPQESPTPPAHDESIAG